MFEGHYLPATRGANYPQSRRSGRTRRKKSKPDLSYRPHPAHRIGKGDAEFRIEDWPGMLASYSMKVEAGSIGWAADTNKQRLQRRNPIAAPLFWTCPNPKGVLLAIPRSANKHTPILPRLL